MHIIILYLSIASHNSMHGARREGEYLLYEFHRTQPRGYLIVTALLFTAHGSYYVHRSSCVVGLSYSLFDHPRNLIMHLHSRD